MVNSKPQNLKKEEISYLNLSYRNTELHKSNLSKEEHQFLDRLQEVISENIQNNHFTVSGLAKCMYMGRGNLYRLIKSLTGLSPNSIISKARLSTGKFLLENSDLRVNEIAEEVGYTDNAYFSRAFRKHYGYPPSQARA